MIMTKDDNTELKNRIKRFNVDINGNFQFNFYMIVNKVFPFYWNKISELQITFDWNFKNH